MIAWIQSHHLHFQWKFKLWAGKVWRQNIAGHCQQNVCIQKFVDNIQQCFAFTPQANFPTHNLNFHWKWRWWDRIQATFWNLFYFTTVSFENRMCNECMLTSHPSFVWLLMLVKLWYSSLYVRTMWLLFISHTNLDFLKCFRIVLLSQLQRF